MTRPTLLFQGALHRASSFSFINRRLVAGLRKRGWPIAVFSTDSQAMRTPRAGAPEIYLFHDHPYDLQHAPGRINAFILNYDYARFAAADRMLASRLNGHFDVLFVPSRFVRRVCRENGVNIPIVVCPWSVDRRDIRPARVTRPAGSAGPFRFLYVGGAAERKGCDLLLRAYRRAFRDEHVSLTIKAFVYDHLLPWIRKVLAETELGPTTAPPVTFEHRTARSVGGYYRAADAGVFPFRGEAFGLPILECLASGLPVIVTRGGGPLDFCRPPFAQFIRTRHVERNGKHQLAPDVRDLARLMSEAVERGALGAAEQIAIARSVESFTWDRTIDILDRGLRSIKPRRRAAARANRGSMLHTTSSRAAVAYAYFEKGRTSWRYTSRKIDACLRRRFADYITLPLAAPRVDLNVDLIVGQSGFCLDRLLDARRRNPSCRAVVYRESAPFEVVASIQNRERSLLKVPQVPVTAMERWSQRRECDLAERIVVLSDASKKHFVEARYPEAKLRVVRPGITIGPRLPVRRARTIRFLFVGTDSFRKGIRLLLAAWDRLRLRHAELWLLTGNDPLESPLVVRYLVRNPSVRVLPMVPNRALQRLYENIDCLVLPTLEDGFSTAVAEGLGRGRPAIVSRAAGVSEIIEHGASGAVIETGSITALVRALQWVSDHRTALGAMGEAAYETALRHPWSDFDRRFAACLEE